MDLFALLIRFIYVTFGKLRSVTGSRLTSADPGRDSDTEGPPPFSCAARCFPASAAHIESETQNNGSVTMPINNQRRSD